VKVKTVSLLGYDKPVKWKQTGKALEVTYPADVTLKHAAVFRIE
jgi:hypothetical protein